MKICSQCQTQYPDHVEYCSNDGMKLRSVLQQSADPLIGRVLDGRWIIDSKIGEGGMGAVYLGRQRSVNRPVAIKTLRPELTVNTEFVDRFFREARIATTFTHPNSVMILDFGQAEGGVLFLAMEYLEGMPLSDRLHEGTMPLEKILTVGDQVAAALEAAHSHGIIHRDLKPDNVFLQKTAGSDLHVKLLDFGIAKDSNASTQYTRTGQIFGTPDYMSPEQCNGVDLDGRSDLYSLGCIFYEMCCGRPPFEGANSMAILMAHVTETPTPPSQLATVPPPMEQLVLKLLAKSPDDRYPDASAVRRAIAMVRAELFRSGTASHHPITPEQLLAARSPDLSQEAFAETMAGESLTPLPAAAPSPRIPTAAVALSPGAAMTQEDLPATAPPSSSKLPLLLLAAVVMLSLLIGSGVAAALFFDKTQGQDAIAAPSTASAPQDVGHTLSAPTPVETTPAPPEPVPVPVEVAPVEEAPTPPVAVESAPSKQDQQRARDAEKRRKEQEREAEKRRKEQEREAERRRREQEREAEKPRNSGSPTSSDPLPKLPKFGKPNKKLPGIKKTRDKAEKIVDELLQ